ncbi:hypothetical protein M409DRAFT_53298 [Zasmidium cellare ATCC 36951]|uniref:Uncharacterized protein n=1 Tax=Zasmidium cellare ATCC 36951 TaxID=1080233 RepID=A0A6A6CNN9_ZASCE|nr:uncharacterized protein M409DRAFT_53298 [Zasmidium cellare ATCC 36951]KAF2168661.1 hypothetical protein M409DRAFT_53298 [Zasmidium cellare ATCC 36951]
MPPPRNHSDKLKGSRVLIIGGSIGIGVGLASAVLEFGGHVIISSSSAQRISQAIDRLRSLHPHTRDDDDDAAIIGIPCDLGNFETLTEQITSLFAEIATHLGGPNQLDHVVFTAGDALPIKPLEAFSLPQIQQAGIVRFFAPLVVAQHLRQNLRPTSGSSFTLTTGGVPHHLMKNWSVAQAYLGGIESMARRLAVDLAPVRVNAIGLGPVETELWGGTKEAGLYEEVRARFESKMTTGRVGEVGDVVEAYLYVLRDWNVSGSIIRSHGGTILL